MVFREWAMNNMLLSMFFLPIGLVVLIAAAVIFANSHRMGTLFRRSVLVTPLFFAVAVYYPWVLNLNAARAIVYASLASIVHLLWAWILDRGTGRSSRRDKPPVR